jgi:hypothetical protein
MFFTTINIANYGDQYELKNFQIITPTWKTIENE